MRIESDIMIQLYDRCVTQRGNCSHILRPRLLGVWNVCQSFKSLYVSAKDGRIKVNLDDI